MNGENDQHTRICILEKMLAVFQEGQVAQLKNEEKAFNRLGDQLTAIFKKIDSIQAERREEDRSLNSRLENKLSKDFVSKNELDLKMEALKRELTKEIKITKGNAYTEFLRLASAFTVAICVCGWIYINILQDKI